MRIFSQSYIQVHAEWFGGLSLKGKVPPGKEEGGEVSSRQLCLWAPPGGNPDSSLLHEKAPKSTAWKGDLFAGLGEERSGLNPEIGVQVVPWKHAKIHSI